VLHQREIEEAVLDRYRWALPALNEAFHRLDIDFTLTADQFRRLATALKLPRRRPRGPLLAAHRRRRHK
jgi:hypothetical protein